MKNKPDEDAEVLLALARANGLKGVRERDAEAHLPLDSAGLSALAQKLEEEGHLRILSFVPFFVVGRESVDYLGRKILPYLSHFHENNPKEKGISLERLKRRFEVPAKVLLLALMTLAHDGKLRQEGREFALADFRRHLPPREEHLLQRLEAVFLEGESRPLTSKDLLERLPVTPQKLQSLLDILIERTRVVACPEGFYVSAVWLDGIIGKVRGLGKKELGVADFKEISGLSRKFAIPLLELLDAMDVTRRGGSSRTVL
jgi:selenocysteine-specific elongation factor